MSAIYSHICIIMFKKHWAQHDNVLRGSARKQTAKPLAALVINFYTENLFLLLLLLTFLRNSLSRFSFSRQHISLLTSKTDYNVACETTRALPCSIINCIFPGIGRCNTRLYHNQIL